MARKKEIVKEEDSDSDSESMDNLKKNDNFRLFINMKFYYFSSYHQDEEGRGNEKYKRFQ